MFNNNNKYYNKYINSLPIKLFKSKNKQNIINPPIFKYNPPINKQIEKNVSNIPFDFDNVIIIKNDVNMPNVVINEIPFILVNNNHINLESSSLMIVLIRALSLVYLYLL